MDLGVLTFPIPDCSCKERLMLRHQLDVTRKERTMSHLLCTSDSGMCNPVSALDLSTSPKCPRISISLSLSHRYVHTVSILLYKIRDQTLDYLLNMLVTKPIAAMGGMPDR